MNKINNFILTIIITLLLVFSFNVKATDSSIVVKGVIINTEIMNDYCKGWSDGYQDGYCYNKVGCIPPIPPICPIRGVNEGTGYKAGYQRGFKAGNLKNN